MCERNMRIREFFTTKELLCPCGCFHLPDYRSIEMLYAMRLILNRPMILNSAARCERYNRHIGGSPDSAHLVGAFDIRTEPGEEWELIRVAQLVGFNGIGFRDNSFLHVDRHHDPAGQVWGYGK